MTIKRGDKGPGVILIQGILHRLGYEIDEVDGVFGKQTLAAVEEFQEAIGVKVDGLVGVDTANALVGEVWGLEDPEDSFEFDEDDDEDWDDEDDESAEV
jgi:N-acetylmuramoyl-L-alanine amidase